MKKNILIGALIFVLGLSACVSPAKNRKKRVKPEPVEVVENIEVDNEVNVSVPASGAEVSSPFLVSGTAPGFWYIEAQIILELRDADGKMLDYKSVMTYDDWMIEEAVSFDGELSFEVSETTNATIVVRRENVSGLPEHEMSFEMPVVLLP
ncbi:hypothetical protein HOD30_04910 [Candidatus Peregrinibacteria bacterium]|jgi:hypothetical protein|nr:hypothetical protein [Candidatus Peregrinibacteria bacterium]MBT4631723.1 hypothetical protein [Candidatus Peregrinibacteria bacterium]MBT5517260.1 hypothetical protein [Candidatus Peregrinibacteria bacterium]MBT5824545.1 hypothetical protein [Candidatus Peregrinibacteria bacterium]